jgi:hypothetical protein
MSPGLYGAFLLNIDTPLYFTVQETTLLMLQAEVACSLMRNFATGCMPIIVAVKASRG